MDVDNLGMMFSLGLGEDKSISRITSMSFSFDLFFSGYLNKICENFQNLYITYSGGDDLFIAGSWNEIVDVAKTINDEFYCYTGKNSELHASGGIYLCKGKYPIKRAAEHAADALESAKKEAGKNSLNIFSCNVSWYRIDEVIGFSEKLLTYLENNKITRTFIYNTLSLYKEDRSLSIPLMGKFLYSLKRNIKDETIQQELKERFGSLWTFAPVWTGITMLKTRK
jgi:CRISPR-associated protein Csm1